MRVDIKTHVRNGYVGMWIVNDRYEIYMDNGVVYDTTEAQDIPQYVFKIRDTLMSIVDLNN